MAARFFKAVSYGPFGWIQAVVGGFVLGAAAFLVLDAFTREHNLPLPLLLELALCGAAAFLAGAAAANYVIGRRILDNAELQAKILAGEVSPAPRADLPGIDLLDRSGKATGETRTRESKVRTDERA